ncbi:hypothetical protein DV736_g1957, partial [Chaetothyriales sp. CBS 134916]
MAPDCNFGTEKPTPTYQPTQPYDDKLDLELPRLLVPPPILDYRDGRASFHVDSADFEREDCRCGSPDFLRALASTYPLTLEHTISKWNYESRRSVQPVLPFLLIGPSNMARDQSFVESAGITFLLAVRSAHTVSKHPRYLDPSRFPSASGLATAIFDLDTPYELITNVRPVVKAINDHLEASCIQALERCPANIRAKVLVFCETGNERSAVVVAAYLMIVYGIKAIHAIQVVQSQRFCINVDDGMKHMLLSLEDIIRAERGVAASHTEQNINMMQLVKSGNVLTTLAKSCKRNLDATYESDDGLSGSMDEIAKGNQHGGVAPFVDISP